MKQIYINPYIALLIITIVGALATQYVLHVIHSFEQSSDIIMLANTPP